MKIVKVLKITDMEYCNNSCMYLSGQVDCFEEGWRDSLLSDNGGDPDGNIWGLINFEGDSVETKNAIAAGAVIVEMYEARYDIDYREEIAGEVEEKEGDWIGISSETAAYFSDEEDAKLSQAIFDIYRNVDIEYYDSFSLNHLIKNEELEEQLEFAEAYKKFTSRIPNFYKFYDLSCSSWCDTYTSSNKQKYFVYGADALTSTNTFCVIREE